MYTLNQTPRINRMVREIELTLQSQPKLETQAVPADPSCLQNGPRINPRRADQARTAATVIQALDRITWVATVLAGFAALYLLAGSLALAPSAPNTAQRLSLPLSAAYAGGAPRADTSLPSANSVFAGRDIAAQEQAPTF